MQAPRKESQRARAERVLFLPRVCLKFRFVDPLHRARSREKRRRPRAISAHTVRRQETQGWEEGEEGYRFAYGDI